MCKPGEVMENSASYFEWMRNEVQKPDFLEGNYLSTDRRIPVTELGTNACSPLASNAIADNVWDNFSSQTYKNLPSVGTITVYNPADGTPSSFVMPSRGARLYPTSIPDQLVVDRSISAEQLCRRVRPQPICPRPNAFF
jgi:hypothetical protein